MSSDNPAIASPLGKKIATENNWDKVKTDKTQLFDVQIQIKPGEADAARTQAKNAGATVQDSYGDMMFAQIEAGKIEQLANGASIRLVEEYSDPLEHLTSEGVTTTNADELHSLGVKGDSVTIAVIDQQFNPDQSEIKDQVIDTIGDSSYFKSGTSGLHGTACAEIVAEMCPNADLVLASALGTVFTTLMDDITSAHDPEVMSMSLGYKPTLRLDGNDYLSSRIEDYTSGSGGNTPSSGGIFAVSAGNEADGDHWDGQYQDSGGYMDFGRTDPEWFEINPTQSGQEIVVQSDAPWISDQNYLLELYDNVGGSQLKSPSKTNTPSQAMRMPGTDTYYLKIKDDGLDGSEHFDIFTWGNYISFPQSTSERSLGIPATSPDADTLTTGAVEHANDVLESFSSRGPTQDGRRGVDIVAPDGTQSDSYGREFYGTSAAGPHTAGAVGLLFDGTDASNDTIRETVFSTARDISDGSVPAPTNSRIGHGYVDTMAAYEQLSSSGDLTFSTQQPSSGEVSVDSVSSGQASTVVVTYTSNSSEYVAGVNESADNLSDKTVNVPLEDAGGFPGSHTAWLFDDNDLSSTPSPGDDVTSNTSDALASDSATVNSGSLSVTARKDVVSKGGSVTLPVTAENADQVMVQNVWIGWFDSSSPDGGSTTDNISTNSNYNFSWSGLQARVTPSLTVAPGGSTYVGGTYKLTVSADDGNGPVETSVQLEIAESTSDGGITVSVYNTSTEAISGATVNLWLADDYSDDSLRLRQGTTNSNGDVTFSGLAVGVDSDNSVDYTAEVNASGYNSATVQLSLYDSTQTSDSVTVTLQSS